MATDTTRDMGAWAMPRRAGIVGAYAVHIRRLAALGQADFGTAFRNAAAISRAGTFARSLGLHGIAVDQPGQVGPDWDQAPGRGPAHGA